MAAPSVSGGAERACATLGCCTAAAVLAWCLRGAVADVSVIALCTLCTRVWCAAIVRDAHAAGVDPEAGRPKIRLFTSAGALLATVQWEQSCAVVAMSWTAKEQLVVVGEDGTVVLFSVHGEKLATFSALPAVSTGGRAMCGVDLLSVSVCGLALFWLTPRSAAHSFSLCLCSLPTLTRLAALLVPSSVREERRRGRG